MDYSSGLIWMFSSLSSSLCRMGTISAADVLLSIIVFNHLADVLVLVLWWRRHNHLNAAAVVSYSTCYNPGDFILSVLTLVNNLYVD